METENKMYKTAFRKIICILMSVLMIFTAFGASVYAVDGEEILKGNCGKEGDNLVYTLYNNKKIVISGNGEMTDFEKGKAPFGFVDFETLVIETGVTSVGSYAFYNCENLASFELPDTLSSLGEGAFEGCSDISFAAVGNKELDISSVKLLDDAVLYCYKNSSAHQHAETNGIYYILIDGEGEDNILMGESGELKWKFDKLTGILTVSGEASLPEFNADSFPWDTVKAHIKEIVFEDGIKDVTADYTVYPSLTSVTVPSSVKEIGDEVLYGNGKLEKLVILNPACTFSKKEATVVNTVIYGYDNSTAKAFAEENELNFEILECLHTNTIETEEVEATCTSVGYTAGVQCETCKVYISGHEETEILEHKWQDATCTEAITCSVCKKTEGESLGHKWRDATCTEAKTCIVCKATEGEALGHKEITIPGAEATCTENGITDGKVCTVCDVTTVEQKDIPAKGHKWQDATCKTPKTCSECKMTTGTVLQHKWQFATCTVPSTCSMCGETEGEALGHIWKDATCSSAKTCSRCKETEGEPLPHTEVILERRAATCTEPGLTQGKKCTVCGYVIEVQRETPAYGHIGIDVGGKPATCTEKGYTLGKKCSLCGEPTSGYKEIEPLGHQWTEATCDKAKTCSVCSLTEGEPLGHNEVVLPAKAATCSATGLTEGKKCTVCGVITVNQIEIAEKDHEETVTPGKEPTCTKGGYTDSAKCSVCGVVTETSVALEAYGHEWIEATCLAPKTCAVCNLKEGKIGDHKIVTVPAKAATYTAAGLTAGKKCEYCDKVTVKQKTVARKKLKKASGLKVKSYTSTSVTLSWKKTTGADSYKVYYSTNGKKWKSVKVKKNTATIKKLKSGTQYRFKVRAFAGKYYGSASKIVKKTTKVKKPTLSSVKSTKKNTAAVTWKKVTNANGYVVEYSTSKKFTKKTTKSVKIKKGKTVKTTLKKLKGGKKYYVRVKAYKTVNKKAVYGSYSSIKSVKVK